MIFSIVGLNMFEQLSSFYTFNFPFLFSKSNTKKTMQKINKIIIIIKLKVIIKGYNKPLKLNNNFKI